MTTIEIFEPAGCCATSSVVIDQNALHFNADMDWCKQQGFEVKRHNLLKNPQSFISNPRVKESSLTYRERSRCRSRWSMTWWR